jgi:SAM-dependent methyltransferase
MRGGPGAGETLLYDVVNYVGRAYPHTHPNNLGAHGIMRGLSPAPLSKCSVLELGCGDGANLIPMASQYPESTFVGMDLGRQHIDKASADARSVGLSNISFQNRDLTTVSAIDGTFDYIIAHGVYSWIPAQARDRLLAICKECLAPEGVAYVSYNAYPGWHFRDVAREIMLTQAAGIEDPATKVEQARAILQFVSGIPDKDSAYGRLLQNELKRVAERPDSVLLHDELSQHTKAFLLSAFAADAGRHGLRYLGDADLTRANLNRYREDVREQLMQAELAILARDQLMDFLDGNSFRRTLLCHAERTLIEGTPLENFSKLWFSSSVRPKHERADETSTDSEELETTRGGVVTARLPQHQAVLKALGQAWPAALSYSDVTACAQGQGGAADDTFIAFLWHAALAGVIDVTMEPPRLSSVASDMPSTSSWARKQAAETRFITNFRHRTIEITGETTRLFLRLLDGTRTHGQLAADLSKMVEWNGGDAKAFDADEIAKGVETVRRLALLMS